MVIKTNGASLKKVVGMRFFFIMGIRPHFDVANT